MRAAQRGDFRRRDQHGQLSHVERGRGQLVQADRRVHQHELVKRGQARQQASDATAVQGAGVIGRQWRREHVDPVRRAHQ